MPFIKAVNDFNLKYIEDYVANKTRQPVMITTKNIACINRSKHKNNDKKPSMSYNFKTKKFKCFTCNKLYDLMDLVQLDYGVTKLVEVYDIIADLYQDDPLNRLNNKTYIPQIKANKQKEEVKTNVVELDADANKQYDFTDAINNLLPITDAVKNHFKSKGLTDAVINKYKLCYCNDFNEPLKDYKDLAKMNIKNYTKGFYILPNITEEDTIDYYIAETVERDKYKYIIKRPVEKYAKIKGINTVIFNNRYIKQKEPIIFIVERNI